MSEVRSQKSEVRSKKGTRFTECEKQFIRENYLKKPIKRIASELGRSAYGVFNFMKSEELKVPHEIVEQRKKNSQFSKGNVSHNKGLKQTDYMSAKAIEKTKETRFKKGNKPHNTNYNGHERISKDGYIEIRVSEGNYQLKHRVEWEKLNGPIPEGEILVCLSEAKSNTAPSNWELISREENMLRNSRHDFPKEVVPSMAFLSKINKKVKQLQND